LPPDVRAVAGLGYSGYSGHELPVCIGLLVPAGTAQDRIETLNAAMREALAGADVKKRLLTPGDNDRSGLNARQARRIGTAAQ
jgi:tripartite-type tricarboxylate transporter receptor subunit TctC